MLRIKYNVPAFSLDACIQATVLTDYLIYSIIITSV